jgi:hypothetical protein
MLRTILSFIWFLPQEKCEVLFEHLSDAKKPMDIHARPTVLMSVKHLQRDAKF